MRDLNQKQLLEVLGDVIRDEISALKSESGEKHSAFDAKLAELSAKSEVSDELRTQIEDLRTVVKGDSSQIDGRLQALSTSLVRLESLITATKSEFDDRISGLDGNLVLKGSAAAILGANLSARRRFAEDITLRKSVVLSGNPPALIKGLVG
jgi:hypothetical protein